MASPHGSLTCDLPEEIVQKFNKFKFKFSNAKSACMILKCNKNTLIIEEEDTVSNVPLEDLQDDLPAGAPRFLICSYKIKTKDDRIRVPLCLVYYSPPSISHELSMLYASTKSVLVTKFGLQKILDIVDPEDFTDEWLESQLQSSK